MPEGMGHFRTPFAPSTVASAPLTATLTPFGRLTGFLPTRDIVMFLGLRGGAPFQEKGLPDLGQELAADILLARVLAAEQALRGREDGDAQAAVDLGDLLG